MDGLKLFALLVAVASIQITAEGPKKKIRIHLPQKVKHIHHHKKIYITNHPAFSQYAPAYMPSAEGAVAVPTNVALPAVANIVPFNSVELYEESHSRVPSIATTNSKLLPLYRARGYYGPTPSVWEEQEYDLSPPPEPTDHSYVPTAFSGPSAGATSSSNYPPKRVKIIKLSEPPRKKTLRKAKPKRVIIRGRPQPEEEHPVSTFHEQFYSDLNGSGTIRKIKKPQRVEKIVDGDTEHIHTYSEEHIHKMVYDHGSKITGVVGVDPIGSMSALTAGHSIVPFKNSQTLLAIPSDTLTGFTAVGSMGTPSHLEYAAYNPREVTHDHIFHDHGEIPPDVEVSKDTLSFPPRISYNNQGYRIAGGPKVHKSKYAHKYIKAAKPTSTGDHTYYDNIYSPYSRPRNILKSTIPTSHYETSTEASIDDYRPIPSFKYKDKGNLKTRKVVPALYFGNGKQVSDYRLQQTNVPAPFSVSSTVVHDYKPNNYAGYISGTVGFSRYKDPLVNFRDNTYSSNFDYDTYASSSNIYASEDKNEIPAMKFQGKKGKKKSISTQNISFGGLDHQTTVDHLEDSGVLLTGSDNSPTALEHYNTFDQVKSTDSATPTAYTIRESSQAHPYYSAMAIKALHPGQLSVAEASNDNFQYAEAPTPTTPLYVSSVATTTIPAPHDYYELENTEPTVPSEMITETRQRHKSKEKKSEVISVLKEPRQTYAVVDKQPSVKEYKGAEKNAPSTHALLHRGPRYSSKHASDTSATSNLKYGDKI